MIFLIAVIFSLAVLFLSLRSRKAFPPGPPSFPIIGNCISVSKLLKELKFHHLVWQHLAKKFGPLVGLRLINDNVVVVSGKTLIKKLYNHDDLNGRPSSFFFKIRTFNKRLGIVFTDGKLWEDQRKFSVKVLRSLGLGMTGMVEYIEKEANELVINLIEKSSAKEGIAIQDKDKNIFDISVINVMWTMLRGERFELNDPKLTHLMETIHRSFQIVDMSGGVLNQLPWLRHIAPDKTGYRPLIETLTPLWNFLKLNIDSVSKTFRSSSQPNNFIEFYCREILKNKKKESFFTSEQLMALCVDFFQAGSETTSNTLAFGMLYMLHYPDVMRRIQAELDEVVGNRTPKLSDRQNLKFTEATLYEIQRMSNVAPVGIAHRATADIKVGEHVIPKNSIVLFNIYSVHMDENCWKDDPKVFKPERFLDEKGDVTANENFIAFGSGKRRCIGENLAKSSLFLFFSSVLHCFNLECVGKLPDLSGKDGITLSPKPFKARFTLRRQ